MASYRKTANGWRADIFKEGIRRSKTFRAKRDAIAWANEIEFEIQNGHHSPLSAPPNSTFSRVLIRYRDEVSPLKRGTRWERIRIDAMLRDPCLPIYLWTILVRAISHDGVTRVYGRFPAQPSAGR